MEYCEGGDLENYIVQTKLSGQRFSEEAIIIWIIQVLEGIQYLHLKRILHRDLKSSNIFIQNGCLKIGDFGISRTLATNEMARTCIGTPCYMSPEVISNKQYNFQSDIWSVGCILYELAALQRAFDGTNIVEVVNKIAGSVAPMWPCAYSRELGFVYTRMVTKDPVQRPSADDALHDLQMQLQQMQLQQMQLQQMLQLLQRQQLQLQQQQLQQCQQQQRLQPQLGQQQLLLQNQQVTSVPLPTFRQPPIFSQQSPQQHYDVVGAIQLQQPSCVPGAVPASANNTISGRQLSFLPAGPTGHVYPTWGVQG
jgi:NIMA (never in mitosis gene a)-related kinase